MIKGYIFRHTSYWNVLNKTITMIVGSKIYQDFVKKQREPKREFIGCFELTRYVAGVFRRSDQREKVKLRKKEYDAKNYPRFKQKKIEASLRHYYKNHPMWRGRNGRLPLQPRPINGASNHVSSELLTQQEIKSGSNGST